MYRNISLKRGINVADQLNVSFSLPGWDWCVRVFYGWCWMRQKGIATRQRTFATDSKNASIKLRLFKIRSEIVEVLVGIGDFF